MSRDQFIIPEGGAPKQEILDDGTVVTRTCAWSPPGCHSTGCGVKLFVKDGKLVKVEGDPDHQVTHGRLCPRCLSLTEVEYSPERILYPMKRDPKDRGKDKWERISWDEATKLMVEKTKEIQEKYGPQSIVLYGGTGRQAVTYGFLFASQVLGTPNYCYSQSGWSCMGPRQTGMSLVLGSQYLELDFGGCYPQMWNDPEYVRPNYILKVGKEPTVSNGDGLWGHSLIELMKQGSKLIDVDPRTTFTGSRAEHHFQIKPNTDAALILALLHVVINEDLYDHDFVDKWCYGFDELKERVQQYTPAFAAAECDVDEEEIVTVARKLATETPWSLLVGVATDQNTNGVQVIQALIDLAAICGVLDVPGGVVMGTTMQFEMTNVRPIDERAGRAIGQDVYPILPVLLNTTHPDLTLEALETGHPYEIHMGWFDSTNLLAPTCSAQPKRWHEALKKMDYNIAKEIFMNPTVMACCDLVFPLATWMEYDGIVMNNYGCQMGIWGAINKAVDSGECKSDLEMLLHFGRAMYGEDWKLGDDVIEYLDKSLKFQGLSWDELSEKVSVINTIGGYRKYERGLMRPDGEPGFITPTGRVELYSLRYEALGEDPLPYYIKPVLFDENDPRHVVGYPLTMTTGGRHYASFHSEHRQIPSLRALQPYPELEIHPKVADELGIVQGEKVIVENPWGSAELRARITPTVRPDVIHADHGWWYPEEDPEEPNLYGVWRSNINEMVPHKVIGKLGFGAPYKCLPARIRKVNA